MYRNIKSLYCVTGANIVLQVNYTTITNKQTNRKKDQICGYHSQLWARVNWIVQSLSRFWLFATPWVAARQASLCITNSWSLSKPMSIESAMPSSHLILCHPLLLLPPILPSIRVFSSESALYMRWPVI